MNTKTLKAIKVIDDILRPDLIELYGDEGLLSFLNLTVDETERIEDAIIVTLEKLDNIRQSKISDLHEHVHIDMISRVE